MSGNQISLDFIGFPFPLSSPSEEILHPSKKNLGVKFLALLDPIQR
jgi:hypothetical protein